MLAANVTETPRPRPPAKVRRSASVKVAATPPPSYTASFDLSPQTKPLDTLLGSPLLATFQRVGWDNRSKDPLSPTAEEDQEWINEKSREELSELLVKAEGLIRERENDLGMASAVCKTLYENNVALKNKHQNLLKRLPSSPSSSPTPEPLSRSSSRYSIHLSRSASEYETSPLARSQARKISFSTSEISHLADQNAELLDKLERVEAEALHADQSGRRELKRLEKEILSLREELEKTQARSEQLEEKAKAGFGFDAEKVAQEVWRKREERDAKIMAMRHASQPHVEGDYQVRSFAPEGSSFGVLPLLSHATPRRPSQFSMAPPEPSALHPEGALISKLLEKIQELERTNSHIMEQQAETANQLNAMQRETDHITKIYECFADEDAIEVATDFGSEEGRERPSNDETIRFRSLKRNLMSHLTDSPRKSKMSQSRNYSSISRQRKSVMGLFDTIEDVSQDSTMERSPASDSAVLRHRSSRSTGSAGFVSPAFSTQSITTSRSHPTNLGPSRLTLEAELGGDLNEGWSLNSNNHHLRTSSLYSLNQISSPCSPISRDRSPSPLGQEREVLPTPPSAAKPSLRLEPPTPDKAGLMEGNPALTGKKSLRLHRMSETVRLRTGRWVDGRFGGTAADCTKVGTAVGQDDPDPEEENRPLTPLSLSLTSAFDAAVLNITGEPSSPVSDSHEEIAQESELQVEAVKKPRGGLGNTMLQVWLWLQFAMVIFIFVWSMARRGPQSVLGGQPRRRVASTTSR